MTVDELITALGEMPADDQVLLVVEGTVSSEFEINATDGKVYLED